MGQKGPAAGLGALSVALHARDLLKEVTIIYSTSTIVSVQFSSGQSLSRAQLFATPWTVAHQASLSITNSQSLHKLMSIESVMPSNHFILSPSSPPAFNLSQHLSLQMSQFCASGGQSIGVSASISVLPMHTQD